MTSYFQDSVEILVTLQ